MSYNPQYDPDDDAKSAGKLFTRQLSQRDLSLQIPVNFVEHAGISLTAACFANNRYVEDATQKCFSNLLAIGYHRYEVDVYWDVSRQLWSLCPVMLGEGESSPNGPSSTAAGVISTAVTEQQTDLSMISMSSEMASLPTRRDVAWVARRQATPVGSSLAGNALPGGSSTPTTAASDETAISTSADATATTSTSASATGSSTGGDYQQVGPYTCSDSVDLDWLSRIMWTYLDTTQTNLNATLRYLILNLHAASPASDPTAAATELPSDDLPDSSDSLSVVMATNLSYFLYTPADLRGQRANINASWYDVPQGIGPNPGYYSVRGTKDTHSTPDGWPSEGYVEMQEGKRLLVGFGSIDAQIQGYDVSQDSDTIFPQNYIQVTEQVALDATGDVTSGCFYQPGQYSITNVNSSWAFAATDTSLTQPDILTSASNLTRCGISPILNTTLQNATADQDFRPYQTYLQSTIWSWAPSYPRVPNDTRPIAAGDTNPATDGESSSSSSNDIGSQPRCAALNASSGFWQNVVCDETHYSACRDPGAIYNWSISSDDASYTKAGITCRDDAAFDVPRTGLQNTYLLRTWRAHLADPDTDSDASKDNMLWLNFNNLDSELCWVVGQNTTCPYISRRSGDSEVIVPVVAAVVVFALGVLTLFVKCAANRRMNKRQRRRRRGDDGWDYEGVPS